MTLFLAALTSALFLHSLLECEAQKQGLETVQNKTKKSPPVDLNSFLISAKAHVPSLFPLL